MKFAAFRYDGSRAFSMKDLRPWDIQGISNKEESLEILQKNRKKIHALQNKLYAQGTQGLILLFQAMDAGGKDGTIKHVFSGVNPSGILVTNFKSPNSDDLSHDYLRRVHQAVPPRGSIGIWNRSHYEDVLIAKVRNLPDRHIFPDAERLWDQRYEQIRRFEDYLSQNGYRIMKFYLHLSKKEQKKRLLARIEDPRKHWKFSPEDLRTRAQWTAYMDAYTRCINETAAVHAPWYVIPADHKWYLRALVSGLVRKELEDMNPAYPSLSKEEAKAMKAAEKRL